MNAYDAILKAADYIERNPKDFDFDRIGVPHACGTPACALGWIGFYMSRRAGESVSITAEDVLGIAGNAFYSRMIALHKDRVGHGWWRDTPALVAENLRAYARKYHAAEASNGEAFQRFLATALTPAETCAATSGAK